MVNGNPAVSKDSDCPKSSQTLKPQLQKCFSKEVSEPLCRSDLPAVQMHFRNYCLDFPEKLSCAIDCFMELSCYIFQDAIGCVECNEFFEILYTTCVQVNSGGILMNQLVSVREPVWAWMRRYCPSFTDMSANAVFSDIFQVNTVGELTFGLFNIPIIPFVQSVTNKLPSLQMCSSCILPITIYKYIRMVLKVLYQKLCCQTSTDFSVFIAKIILEVLLCYDTLFPCQHC